MYSLPLSAASEGQIFFSFTISLLKSHSAISNLRQLKIALGTIFAWLKRANNCNCRSISLIDMENKLELGEKPIFWSKIFTENSYIYIYVYI